MKPIDPKVIGHATGSINCEKLYLPGLRIEAVCPGCGKQIVYDYNHSKPGGGDYLIDPACNEWEPNTLYCDACGEEWDVEIRLNIGLEVRPDANEN